MPTYEYRCNACQREFEYQQRMSDPDLTKCEACGEDKLEKLISWTAVGSSNQGLYSGNPKAAYTGPRGVAPPKKETPAPAPASEPASAPAPQPNPAPAPEPTLPDADGATVADTDKT